MTVFNSSTDSMTIEAYTYMHITERVTYINFEELGAFLNIYTCKCYYIIAPY